MAIVKPITNPERLEKAWKQAKATAEFEGTVFTKEDEEMIKGIVSNEMVGYLIGKGYPITVVESFTLSQLADEYEAVSNYLNKAN